MIRLISICNRRTMSCSGPCFMRSAVSLSGCSSTGGGLKRSHGNACGRSHDNRKSESTINPEDLDPEANIGCKQVFETDPAKRLLL